MSSVEAKAHYESASVLLTDANITNVLTCPAAGGTWYVVTGLNICASTGSVGTADVIRYDAALTRTIYLRYQSVVPAAGSLDLEFRPIVLRANDILKVRGANLQHVDVSYMVGRSDPQEFAQGLRR